MCLSAGTARPPRSRYRADAHALGSPVGPLKVLTSRAVPGDCPPSAARYGRAPTSSCSSQSSATSGRWRCGHWLRFTVSPQAGGSTVITYFAAYAVGALASAVQLGTMFVPAIRPLNPDGAFVWILLCGCVILSAIGSAWSWRRTLDPWRRLIKATGARL